MITTVTTCILLLLVLTARACDVSACGSHAQVRHLGEEAKQLSSNTWLRLAHLAPHAQRACWRARVQCVRDFIANTTQVSDCTTARVLLVEPFASGGLGAAINVFVATMMIGLEFGYSVAMLAHPAWRFARGCSEAFKRPPSINCFFQHLGPCRDFKERIHNATVVSDVDANGQELRALMQRGVPTIALKRGGGAFSDPQPLDRVARFAASIGVPRHYIQAHVTKAVLRPNDKVRAAIDADQEGVRSRCQATGATATKLAPSRVAAIHVRASDAYTDGRTALPATDYVDALGALATDDARRVHMQLPDASADRTTRVGTSGGRPQPSRMAEPLCVFIAADVAHMNASHFEAIGARDGWQYVSAARRLLAPGVTVANSFGGANASKVAPMTIALEAIMDIFQLVKSDLYVGSYSNWAYVVLALRLANSLNPSDPSDAYYRSSVLMNGNPSVPSDPYATVQLAWADAKQRRVEHVPVLHAMRDAGTLFPHLLLFTHWVGG